MKICDVCQKEMIKPKANKKRHSWCAGELIEEKQRRNLVELRKIQI